MSNPYYNNTETLIPTAKARASDVEAKFDAVGAGFDAIDVVLDTKAPANSPALTGTPTAPTASPGTNTTQIATTAFVQQQAFSSTLPDQTGNSGKFLKTNGITASWDTTGIGTGSVTSVAMSVPAFLSVAGSPITASGTLAVDFSGSALPAANGGTGNITYTVGDILYASGATALAKLAAVATGNVLISGGVGVAPSWGKVSLSGTQHVTGTLPVGNGGTGATTLTGLVKGNGTGAFTAATAGTDYLAPPSGSAILKANAGGALASATAGTDYAAPSQTFYLGTTQIAINRASGALTLAGITLTTPNIGTPSAGNLSNCTADGSNEVGYKGIPQNSQSANYTLVLADAGKHVLHPSADTTGRVFTIPANASVAYPVGTSVTFVNQNGAGSVTISITSDTMRLAGAGTTGSRTLAANGIATAVKLSSTEWIISGVNLT